MIFSKIMDVFEWVMHFVYLNVLFVIGILVGGGVFGLFPACYATITVSQQLVLEPGFGITKKFWDLYKNYFWKSLRVGYLFLIVIIIVISNVLFWQQINYMLSRIWMFISLITILGSMLLFPITVGNNLSFKELGKLFFYSLGSLHLYLMLISGLGVIFIATLLIPGVFIFFVGSLSLTWLMFVVYLLVRKIQKISECE